MHGASLRVHGLFFGDIVRDSKPPPLLAQIESISDSTSSPRDEGKLREAFLWDFEGTREREGEGRVADAMTTCPTEGLGREGRNQRRIRALCVPLFRITRHGS